MLGPEVGAMTEAEWLAGGDPTPMLKRVKGKVSDRKLRLWSCGCIRRIWAVLVDKRSREAVVVAEDFADGRADLKRMRSVYKASERAWLKMRTWRDRQFLATLGGGSAASPPLYPDCQYYGAIAASAVADTSRQRYFEGHAPAMAVMAVRPSPADPQDTAPAEQAAQASLVRCTFGNPFRPVVLLPDWRTDTAVVLARRMYESRDFSAMPILADALQDAGCDNADVLDHCRHPKQVHVRGCWVIDLVLGKV